MRSTARNTFNDRAPLLAPWGKPQVIDIELTKRQVDSIVSAADPKEELRNFYRGVIGDPQKN